MSEYGERNRRWRALECAEKLRTKTIIAGALLFAFIAGYLMGFRHENKFRVVWSQKGQPVCVIFVNKRLIGASRSWHYTFAPNARISIEKDN